MYVFLTTDVETYTGNYDRDVQGHGLGLDYILETCQRYKIRSSFFVEALGSTRWGIEPLKRICRDVLESNQDVQLHVHPSVASIEGFHDEDDILLLHPQGEQQRLLEVGLERLSAAGSGSITAFRAGDLAANSDTLAAMASVGLYVSSNRDFDKKSSIRSELNEHFPVANDASIENEILDIPVSVLTSPFPRLDGRFRHMEISAMGAMEMCDGLEKMRRAGYACATILTHPGEFFIERRGKLLPVSKNRKRLESVLGFVNRSPEMEFAAFDEDMARLAVRSVTPPIPQANPAYSFIRVLQQIRQRLVGSR